MERKTDRSAGPRPRSQPVRPTVINKMADGCSTPRVGVTQIESMTAIPTRATAPPYRNRTFPVEVMGKLYSRRESESSVWTLDCCQFPVRLTPEFVEGII